MMTSAILSGRSAHPASRNPIGLSRIEVAVQLEVDVADVNDVTFTQRFG